MRASIPVMMLLAALTLALLGCVDLSEAEKRVNAGTELYDPLKT